MTDGDVFNECPHKKQQEMSINNNENNNNKKELLQGKHTNTKPFNYRWPMIQPFACLTYTATL